MQFWPRSGFSTRSGGLVCDSCRLLQFLILFGLFRLPSILPLFRAVLAVIKILNSLREALLVTPVDYFKLIGVLSSLDYWALAFLVFDIRNTIVEIEKNDVEGDPTV